MMSPAEEKCDTQNSPDAAKAQAGGRMDELSATTGTSYSSTKEDQEDINEAPVEESGEGETSQTEESLLGTCVSFKEGSDCSEATSCSDPTESHKDYVDCEETGGTIANKESSEDALMAVIAAATARKGDEANFAAFFASAEAEAVAAAEQMEKDPAFEDEESQEEEEEDEDELLQRIEHQLTNLNHTSCTIPGAGKGSNVAEVLQDLERVLFFTDVVDRNPEPPSSFTAPTALVSSSQMMSSWWETKIQEVSNTVYQSSVDLYNEVERTGAEVQRMMLFTDVPDGPDDGVDFTVDTGARELVAEESPSAEPVQDNSACTSDDKKTITTLWDYSVNEAGEKREDSLKETATKSFNEELGQLFKGLEQKLLFTDLPDMPRPPSKERSPTNSMTLTPTASAQSAPSLSSALGICRAQPGLLSQVLVDGPDGAREWPNEENAATGNTLPTLQVSNSNAVSDALGVAASKAVGDSLTHALEESSSMFTAPEMSDISSTVGGSIERMVTTDSKLNIAPESRLASNSKVIQMAADHESVHTAEPFQTNFCCPREYEAASVAETSTSIRLLVEVQVDKSSSDSTASGYAVDNATIQSDASTTCNERKGEGVTETKESDDKRIHPTKEVRSWTSMDERNLATVMKSSDDASQEAAKNLSSVLEKQQPEGKGSMQEETRKAESGSLSWVGCSSSSCADTYATAQDDDNVGDSRQAERYQAKQSLLEEVLALKERLVDPDAISMSTSDGYLDVQADDLQEQSTTLPAQALVEEVLALKEKLFVTHSDSTSTTDEYQDVQAPEAADISGVNTFDALLAEMKHLETAINVDLQKAHTVLRKTMKETDTQNDTAQV